MTQEKSRLREPDLLRTAALFGVIAQHILGAYARRPGIGSTTMRGVIFCFELTRFAVPLFVFLFGMMLVRTDAQRFSYPRYLGKRTRQLLLPYLIWTLLYQLGGGAVRLGDPALLRALPMLLLTGDGAYHLWYVPMIFQFVLLAFVFVPLFARIRRMRLPALGWGILLALSLGFLAYLQWKPDYSRFLWRRQSRLFPSWMLYFVCGALCGSYYEKFCAVIRRGWPLFAAATAAFLIRLICRDFAAIDAAGAVQFNVVGLQQPRCALYLLCAFACLHRLAMALGGVPALARAASFCGRHSYRAYLAHVICLTQLNNVLLTRLRVLPVYYALLFVLTSAASLVLAWALDALFARASARLAPRKG